MLLVGELLFALVVSLLIVQLLKQRWRIRQLPPGPTLLPFLGNLLALNFELHHETLIQLAKTYGNIFTIWLGIEPVIILNGYKTVRKALTAHSEELSGRPSIPFVGDILGTAAILSSNGHTWRQQRRFGMMTMRNLGVGKKSLEVQIQEVAQKLIEQLSFEKGKPTDPNQPIVIAVSNVICSVVFGHCFDINDGTFQQMIKATNLVVNARNKGWSRLYDAFPSLMQRLLSQNQVFVQWEKLRTCVKQEIRTHQENLDDEPQDFIDFYLKQIDQTKGDPFATYNEESLTQVVGELFFAGSETTTTTLRWALLHMANRPEIQEKVQRELDAVLRDSQIIHYEDRNKLPYTNAVIHELQRYCNVIPVGVPRECIKDVTLQGFLIEKSITVLPNLSSCLFDPEHWETPHKFNPGHFLDKDGNFVTRDAFLPFSAGHRVCFGEQLARTELFIFFSSLLRAFTIRPPEGVKKLNEGCIVLGAVQPHPYKICAVPR